jgi:hypothetical protein
LDEESQIPDPPQSVDAPREEVSAADLEAVVERSLVRRLSSALRFADFMALLMVAATGFSAYATWRTAQVTHELFTVAERPYIGMQRVSFDVTDHTSARLIIDLRNFGSVSARAAVVRFRLLVDGKVLAEADNRDESTVNVGNFSPQVPHPFHLFVPIKVYDDARAGRARIVLYVQLTFQSPDQRPFCYNETMTYDYRADTFDPKGGDDHCDGEIF